MKNLLIFCVLLITIFSYSQEKRLALVIGNSDYEKGELKNPVNDAKLIARTLDSLGFDVIAKYNLATKRELLDVIRDFGVKRESYDVGFVYYAGHGVQVKDENFLLPTKEVYNSELDVQDFGVSVQSILRYLESKTDQVNILILDACRDNPFEAIWNKTRSLQGGGLAKIPPPTGSLIAFSTDVGQTAADGKNENSIYTESLAKNMLIENISIDQVFRNVRSEVLAKTKGTQRPVEATQLTGNSFYLVKSNYEKQFKRAEEQIKNKEFLDALATSNFILQNEPNNVKALLLRASIYSGDLNQNNKALLDFEKAIQIQPKDANIYYQRTEVFEKLKQYNKALLDYNKAIELSSNNSKYYNARGRLFEYELNQFEKALLDYNKAIEIEPKEVDGLFNRAHLYQTDLGQYDKALSDYLEVINLDPKYSDAYNNIAILFKNNIQNDEKAQAFYNKKIELNPTDYIGYVNRGDFFQYNLKDNEKALLDYNKAIDLSQNNATCFILRGQLYEMKLKQYDKALADYNKAIELEPKETTWIFRRAIAYKLMEQYDNSLSDYLKLIEMNPKDPSVYNNIGNLYRDHLKNYDKALESFSKKIELEPTDPIGFLNRGFLNYKLNNVDKILLDFNKAIELEPKNASFYSYRGQLYQEKLLQYDKALTDYNKAIELESDNASYYLNRANLLRLKFKKFELAILDFDKAIQLEPKNSTLYSNRAIFELFDLGLKDKANQDLNKAIELDPEDRGNFYYRIKSFIFYEDFENALKDIQKTILLDKNDPEGYYDLFVIYKKQKKYLQALLQISKAIELLDGSSYEISDDKAVSYLGIEDLYIFRAELYKLLSDYESTCEDYKNALNSLKDNPTKKKEIELLVKENCK